MSSVCVLTPIVVGSWPAISAAVLGAAGAMGFAAVGAEERLPGPTGRRRVETDVPNSEVVSETLARGEKIRFTRDGVSIEFGVDGRGKCTVCATGEGYTDAQLRRIGEEVAGRIVQQFTYHKLVSELKQRGYSIAEESVEGDQSIQLRVRLGQ
ncbi:MAG: DUF1257 domain-containing protein [Phycisphaerales bacterium]|nr:DUF1257 domain-containing protein [Phycisphaerales bacterium]